MTLRCLWIRRWIDAYLDRSLSEARARRVVQHLDGCPPCRESARRQERLVTLVRSAADEMAEPSWTGFWPGIRVRLLSEGETVGRLTHRRWVPHARPAWPLGWLPRLALASAIAGVFVFSLALWRSDGRVDLPGPGIVVQALEAPDPETSVMVFSTPEHEMTVIWIFGLRPSADQSLRPAEEVKGGWLARSSSRAWL